MSKNTGQYRTKKSKPNYVYSILSVALVLFLLGFFGLIALHASELVRLMKEQVNILVEIRPGTSPENIQVLHLQIETKRSTKRGSVQLINKEMAMQELKTELGEDFTQFGFQNPLYDMIRFNTKAEFLSAEFLAQLKEQLLLNPSVQAVYYQEGLVNKISKNIERLALFSIISGVLLLLIALTLIHNTIKLALYANRMLIKNMELVGASWSFISRPYLKRGIANGFWSALIAIALLTLLIGLLYRELPEIQQLGNWTSLAILFGGLFLLGILITGSSTYFVVNKYLRMRLDDLY